MSTRPKLSCTRCRVKKLKCDKLEPCSRCKSSGAICTTSDRKPRAKQTAKVDTLNAKITLLEEAIQKAFNQSDTPFSSITTNGSLDTLSTDGVRIQCDASASFSPAAYNTQPGDIWIKNFQKVRAAMDAVNEGDHQGSEPVLSSALHALDDTIADLDGYTELDSNERFSDIISKEEARQAVENTFELLGHEFMIQLLDRNFMISLGEILDTPFVQVDAAALVAYYTLVFHGHILCQYKSATTARKLYLQCLQAVPKWQASMKQDAMDLCAATLLSWTCAICSDVQLSWEFHNKACLYARHIGLPKTTAPMPNSQQPQADLEASQKKGFWQLVLSDLSFRLCFDKPAVISEHLPALGIDMLADVDVSRMQPKAISTLASILWARLIFILRDFFVHENVTNGHETMHLPIRNYAIEIEELMTDWSVLAMMRATTSDDNMRTWFFAEIIVAAYSFICHMERLRLAKTGQFTSQLSLRASRMVLDIIIEHQSLSKGTSFGGLSLYWMAFYPFHAMFNLYYNMLEAPGNEDCVADIHRLETYASITRRASATRFEYVPIAKAIESLNRITRYVYESRRSQNSTPKWALTPDYATNPMMYNGRHPSISVTSQDNIQPSDAEFMQYLPSFNGYQPENSEQFRSMVNTEQFEPLTYMQQVENQFVGSHANYGNWWDVYSMT